MNALPFGISPMRRFMLICTAPWLVLSLSCSVGALLLYPLLIVASWLALLAFFYHVFRLCAELYVITPEMFLISKGLLNKTVTWLNPCRTMPASPKLINGHGRTTKYAGHRLNSLYY
jgi:hypothetical protein